MASAPAGREPGRGRRTSGRRRPHPARRAGAWPDSPLGTRLRRPGRSRRGQAPSRHDVVTWERLPPVDPPQAVNAEPAISPTVSAATQTPFTGRDAAADLIGQLA